MRLVVTAAEKAKSSSGRKTRNLSPVPAAVGGDVDRRAPLLPEDAGAGGRDRKSGGVA
jgi:hypothetical protein